MFARGFCLDSRICSYCFQNQSQSCSANLSKREPKDTIFAALLWRPESVIPWFHERFVARCPIGQIWDRWWVYEVFLFGKTANKQSNGSWVVDCNITNLQRTNATASVPQRICFMLKRGLNHKYSKGYKEKLLSEAQSWQQSEKQRLLRKFNTNKTNNNNTYNSNSNKIGMPTKVFSPFHGQCCTKISQHILEGLSFCVRHTHKTIWVLYHRLGIFFLVCHCVNIECFHCQEVTALNQTLESLVKALYTTGLPYPIMSI